MSPIVPVTPSDTPFEFAPKLSLFFSFLFLDSLFAIPHLEFFLLESYGHTGILIAFPYNIFSRALSVITLLSKITNNRAEPPKSLFSPSSRRFLSKAAIPIGPSRQSSFRRFLACEAFILSTLMLVCVLSRGGCVEIWINFDRLRGANSTSYTLGTVRGESKLFIDDSLINGVSNLRITVDLYCLQIRDKIKTSKVLTSFHRRQWTVAELTEHSLIIVLLLFFCIFSLHSSRAAINQTDVRYGREKNCSSHYRKRIKREIAKRKAKVEEEEEEDEDGEEVRDKGNWFARPSDDLRRSRARYTLRQFSSLPRN